MLYRTRWTRMKSVKGLRELAAPGVIIALVGLNLLQTNSLRQEIAAVRSDLSVMIADLYEKFEDFNIRVTKLEVRQELRHQLENRFDESGEGLEEGGSGAAADRLLVRAEPEIDAALAAQNGNSPILLAYELATGLWDQRAQILARDVPRLK